MDSQKVIYRQEAHEILFELEAALLAFEKTPEDDELIDRLCSHLVTGGFLFTGHSEPFTT